jgi:predicted ATPase/DNA-binding SARP family transcriptional activator
MQGRISAIFLGGFKVFRGSEPVVGFGYDKVKALFAYLAVEDPIPFNRDLLAGLFWPEHPKDKAHHSLRQAVLRLRSLFQEDPQLFLIHRTVIQRNPLANVSTDVHQFESFISRYSSGGKHDITSLESAVKHYRGEFLKGLSMPGVEAFEEWLFNHRGYFHRRVVYALEKIVVHYERHMNYDQARLNVEKLLELEPWREEAHRKLMLLFARMGQRSAALRQYEVCRHFLLEHLDLLPDEETDSLHRRIREMRSSSYSTIEPTTPLIGRDSELSRLKRLLSDPYTRLVTITGPGGIGKTRLALQLLKDIVERDVGLFLNGAVVLELNGVHSTDKFLSVFEDAFHLTLQMGIDKKTQIIQYLKDKELLIILDNFEQLVDDDSLYYLTTLLKETQNVKFVATSRRKLNLSSEVVLSLKGLSYPDPTQNIRVDNLLEQKYGAVNFFLLRLRQSKPDLVFSEEDIQAVVRLCQLVEGLPLALLLAAAWGDSLSIPEITAAVDGNLDFLRVEWQDLPKRHRSMRAALNVSWNFLEPEERQVFSHLSIFHGGFSLEAAQAIAGASQEVISSLVNKSILNYDVDKRRYSLHELLLQFGSEKLAQNNLKKKTLQDRHSQFFSQIIRKIFPIPDKQDEKAVLYELEREIDNYQEAWRNACKKGRTGEILDLSGGLHFFLTGRALYQQGIKLFEFAFYLISDQESSNPLLDAYISAYLGDIVALSGDWEKGRELLKRALDAVENAVKSEIYILHLKAFILSRLGAFTPNAEEAKDYLECSLALLNELGDERQGAYVLAKLGDMTRITGDLEGAKDLLEESLRLQEAVNSPQKINTMVILGLHALRMGDLEKSAYLFREAAALARKQDNKDLLAAALEAQGMGRGYSGNFQEAIKSFEQSLKIRQEMSQKANISNCCAFIGLTKLHLGLTKEARVIAQQAYSLSLETGDSPTIATSLWVKGAVLLAAGALEDSKKSLLESISYFHSGWQQDWHSRRGMVYAFLSGIESCKGDLTAAKDYLKLGLQPILANRSYLGLLHCLTFGAKLLIMKGDQEKAVKIYSLVKMQPFVKNSVFFDRVMGGKVFFQNHVIEKEGREGMVGGMTASLWKASISLLDFLG